MVFLKVWQTEGYRRRYYWWCYSRVTLNTVAEIRKACPGDGWYIDWQDDVLAERAGRGRRFFGSSHTAMTFVNEIHSLVYGE